jgi:hypothetical protein
MSIKVKKFKKDKVAVGAKIALTNRLFVSGWHLSWELRLAIQRPDMYELAVTYKDNIPVAVALMRFRKSGPPSIGAFCRKKERKNGYAKLAVQSLKPPKKILFGDGINGSEKFWGKVL